MQTDEPVVPYRKKREKHPPKKADHKHEFVDCVFEFNPAPNKYAYYVGRESTIGTYCHICGKVGSLCPSLGCKWRINTSPYADYISPCWTDDAVREFDPKTRALPAFTLDDYFQKFVTID